MVAFIAMSLYKPLILLEFQNTLKNNYAFLSLKKINNYFQTLYEQLTK